MAEDWTPAFRGQRPPFEPGNEYRFDEGNDAAATHGAYSPRRLIEAAEEEYAAFRASLVPWDPIFELPTRSLAEIRARKRLVLVYLDVHGLHDEAGNVRAILHELPKWERRETELLREMAATVRSRVELDIDRITRERGLIDLAEAKELIDGAFAIAGRYVPAESQGAFIAELEAFARGWDGRTPAPAADTVEGAARQVESGESDA